MEKATLSTRALEFLLSLHDSDASQEESIGTLCVLAEQLQSGATAGATIIDGSTLHHISIGPPYIGTCAQAVCEKRIVVCPDIASDTRFDAGWRRLYLGVGLRSVQSAPVFSFDCRALGTFVVALRQPGASYDAEVTGFGVYAMRTILQKTSH
jgi:GAF domain-containing protein